MPPQMASSTPKPRPGEALLGLILAALAFALGCDTSSGSLPAGLSGRRAEAAGSIGHSVSFVQGYARGHELAEQQGKPMLVFFSARWCNFCRQMADETFTDADVVRLAVRFVAVMVDAEAEPEVCREFRVRGYPTVQFLSPQGVPLNRLVGRRPPDQLIPQMQAALGATASRSLPTTLR